MKYMLLLFFFTSLFAQDFESDKLPIGDPVRKFNYAAVKLDKIYNSKLNKDVSLEEMISDLANKNIVLVGETHTNQFHHDVQLDVIKGLVKAGKKVILALEMYNSKQDSVLNLWSEGKTNPDTFIEQTDFLTTWSHNYRYYKAIFDYSREQNIPMFGVNTDRKYASLLGKVGLKGLSDEERNAIPEVDTTNTEHKFFIKTVFQGMDATMPSLFSKMYSAQCLWDTAMGEGAIELAKKNPDAVIVVLVGSGHVVYNIGIGRIISARSDLSFASVVTIDVPEQAELSGMMKVKKEMQKAKKAPDSMKKNHMKNENNSKKEKKGMMNHMMGHGMGESAASTIVVRSYADYLWGKKEMEHELYPAFGLSLTETENQFEVKRVLPKTIAYENGIRTGDIILSVDGKKFGSLFDLKKYLHFRNFDDEIRFSVLRESKKEEIKFVIKPIPEEE